MSKKESTTSLRWPLDQTWVETPPPSLIRRTVRKLLAISPRETSFARRKFRCDSEEVRLRLEGVAGCFVRGYHLALETDPPDLDVRLAREEPESQGFAFEGAALGLTVLDVLTGWLTGRRGGRLHRFLQGAGDAHAYIVHVGAGWALARLPLSPASLLRRLDPLLGWLALDGYGFHEGFFHWPQSVERQEVPARLSGYERRAFDQGLGRSLWFVEGTGVARIARRIAAFPAERRPDLWSGVGLACGYAGGRDRSAVMELRLASGEHAPELAQGAAFAAEARERAGIPVAHTELASQALCGMSAERAAAITREAGQDLPPDGEAPAFEVWRRRIQARFQKRGTRS
ncbi:MAG TPA: DUF1702 family protein [Thermoanaerobaculia bacterium]